VKILIEESLVETTQYAR